MMLAFTPEKKGNGNVDYRSGQERGKRENPQAVRCGPADKERGGNDGRYKPEFLARVELSPEKKADSRKADQDRIKRSKKCVSADPERNCWRQIMKSVKNPRGGPKEQVRLAFK